MRVFRDTGNFNAVGANADTVVADCPLPAGSRMNNAWLEMHILGPEDSSARNLHVYALSGYVIPVLDPDTPSSVHDLWDEIVPKAADIGSNVFDMDTATPDTGADYEIGEMDFQEMFKLGVANIRQFYKRVHRISAARAATGYTVAAPDTYLPADFVKSRISKGIKVNQPSVAMMGVSSPDLTDTTTVVPTTYSETNWIKLQYIDQTVEQMLDYLIGLTSEGTGTSPYDEAATLVAEYVAPDYYEQSAGRFLPVTWEVFTFMTFDVTIPGRLELRVLTSGV